MPFVADKWKLADSNQDVLTKYNALCCPSSTYWTEHLDGFAKAELTGQSTALKWIDGKLMYHEYVHKRGGKTKINLKH